MHNVLNVYSKQLRQNMTLERKNERTDKPPTDRVDLSPKGKRQTMIEKVSKDILDKISRYGSLSETRPRIAEQAHINSKKEVLPGKANKAFVFNAIDTINKKRKNTLSVDDPSYLIQRLEQLAKSDPKPVSWI
jgi:hypothetical protein